MRANHFAPSIVAAALACIAPITAQAVPLFARQTGQQCAACHNGFPELTPYGRLFKLSGYTFGGGQSSIPPISAMVVGSFTNTQASQPGGAAPHYADNNNLGIDFVSIAKGMGCDAMRVSQSSELVPALQRGLAYPGTSLIEVMVDSAVPLLYAPKN